MGPIVVLGGGGKLGQELKRQRPDDVVALTHKDCDINDYSMLYATLRDLNPGVVVHAAALTDLFAIETELREAGWTLHVDGTRRVAAACRKLDLSLIFPSTDYVFDGYHGTLHSESAIPSPCSYYGWTKVLGEQIVIAAGLQEWLVLRGTMKDRSWRHARAPTDMWFSPLLREDYAAIILRFIGGLSDTPSGIYHIGSRRTNVFDWARHWRPDVEAVTRRDLDAFPLPRDVSLDTSKAEKFVGPMPVYDVPGSP